MARQKGLISYSNNFEVTYGQPLDARVIVENKSDLTTLSTWEYYDNNVYLYNGLVVAVYADVNEEDRGLYMLIDFENYNLDASWLKVGGDLGAGATGPQGATGFSAYDIWIDGGGTGSEVDFLDSLVGPQGNQGISGNVGASGVDGSNSIRWTFGPYVNGGFWSGNSGNFVDINLIYINKTANNSIDTTEWLANISVGDIISIYISSNASEFGTYVVDSITNNLTYYEFDVTLLTGNGDIAYLNTTTISYSKSGMLGPQGLQGFQGLVGSTGPQGAVGPSAEDLDIFYENTLIVDPLGDDTTASSVISAGSPHKYFNTIDSAINYANSNYSSGMVNIKVQAGEYIQSDSLVIGSDNFQMSLELDSGVLIKSDNYVDAPSEGSLIKMIGLNPSIIGKGVIELTSQSNHSVDVFNLDTNGDSHCVIELNRINNYNSNPTNIFFVDNTSESTLDINYFIDSEVKSYATCSVLNISNKNVNLNFEFSDKVKMDCIVGTSSFMVNNNGNGKSIVKASGKWLMKSSSLLGDIPLFEYHNENCELILDNIEISLVDENETKMGHILSPYSGLSYSNTLYFSVLNNSFINNNILSNSVNNIYNKSLGVAKQNTDLYLNKLK